MTSGSAPTARQSVARSTSPTTTTSRIETTYIANTTVPACAGKNVVASST